MSSASLPIPRDGQAIMRIPVQRSANTTGGIQLWIDSLPDGVTTPKNLRITANQNQLDIPLKADTTAKIATSALRITGTMELPSPIS